MCATALLTTAQAAERVCRSARTLERFRAAGEGPKYLKIGRWVRYRAEDLDEWLETRARTPASAGVRAGAGGRRT